MKKLLATLAALIFCISAGVEFANPKADNFTLATEKGSSYWSPGVGQGELSAADLYRMMYGRSDNTVPQCDTVLVLPSRQIGDDPIGWEWIPKTDNGFLYESASLYWPAIKCDDMKSPTTATAAVGRLTDGEEEVHTLADVIRGEYVSVTYRFDSAEKFWITAPHTGTITTSHSACDFGQSMNFTFEVMTQDGAGRSQLVTIQMSIKNGMGWWCCRGKEPTETTSITGDLTRPMYTANTKSDLRGKTVGAGYLLIMADKETTVTFTRTAT